MLIGFILHAQGPYLLAQCTAHLEERLAAAPLAGAADRVVEDACDAAGISGHQHDFLPEVERLLDVVRDEQRRRVLLVPEPEEDVLHLLARDGVERRERLVHQQDVRLQQEGAREAHALLLAAA